MYAFFKAEKFLMKKVFFLFEKIQVLKISFKKPYLTHIFFLRKTG